MLSVLCKKQFDSAIHIIKSYSNLLDGSENHLRVFVRNIETIIGKGNYEAQYLTQEQADEILGR